MNLTQKISRFVREHNLLVDGDRMVAAVSGGVDSVVMLDVLLALRDQLHLTVVAAHFNHRLRGEESNGDEEFVRRLAAEGGLECYVERADTAAEAVLRKNSVQETARDLRYGFFSRLRDSLGFSKIATAHNADDNAETVLLNLIRGAGVHGLAGIPVWRRDLDVVRPLLSSTREEIEAYAKERSLLYRVDSTNAKSDYTRNYLRNAVLPLLKDNVNPNVIATLNRTAELFTLLDQFIIREAEHALDRIVLRKQKDEIAIDAGQLHSHPVFMQEYLLLLAGKEFLRKDIGFAGVKGMLSISHAKTGASLALAEDCVVFRDRGMLLLRRPVEKQPFSHKIEPDKQYTFSHFRFSSRVSRKVEPHGNGNVEYIDADRLGESLVLRSWSEGDRFHPLGMEGSKKLSDFLIDAGVPLYEKSSIPVLESDGAIVWICGMRLDNRFRITEATKHLLRLEFEPLSPSHRAPR